MGSAVQSIGAPMGAENVGINRNTWLQAASLQGSTTEKPQ